MYNGQKIIDIHGHHSPTFGRTPTTSSLSVRPLAASRCPKGLCRRPRTDTFR
jgi:hypothetical protein